MAKLNFIHLADNASQSNNGKLNINGIFSKISADGLPAKHSIMYVVANISVDDANMHKIEIKFKGPDAKKVLEPFKKDFQSVDRMIGVILTINDFPIESFGDYMFNIFLDDNKIGEQKLIIAQK